MPAFLSYNLDDLIRMRFDVRNFSLLPKQPVTSLLSGKYASRLRGRGLVFEELRGYRPGDDIRTIDWKATARLRKTQIRVYTEERERPVMLCVDQRTNMFFGSARTTKASTAVELASLAAWRTLEVGDRVGAVIFGDEQLSVLRAKRNQTNVLRILNELLVHNGRLTAESQAAKSTTLNAALARVLNLAKHDNLVILATDFADANEETRRLVTAIAARNDVLACLVYDPFGISFTGNESLLFTDGKEVKRIFPISEFAARLKESFLRRSLEIREVLNALRVPILPLCTHEPVADQLAVALGAKQ